MLEINTRTNQYADYFLPSTIKLWNNLPLTLRKNESLFIFKKKQLLIILYTRFVNIRQELINLLILGTNELMDEQNTLIFVSIQK